MSKQIGALWLKEYERDGIKKKMMSGEVDLGILGNAKISIFKNEKKEKENQPDYRIYLQDAYHNTSTDQ